MLEIEGVLVYGCERTGRLQYSDILPEVLRLSGLTQEEIEGILPYITDLSFKSIGLGIAKYANATTLDNFRWQKLHEVARLFIFR